MSAGSTKEPVGTSSAPKAAPGDPWDVPAQPVRAPKAGVPRERNLTPQQAARVQKQQQAQARIAARMTWPLVARLMTLSAACRVAMAGVLIAFGLENMHLHGLLVSPTTTQDQWDAAIRTSNNLRPLDIVFGAGLMVPSMIWNRVRFYVGKLPGVAPHPMQSSNAMMRAMRVPAYWPPVPEGKPSWTRRIHWRVPPGVTATFLLFSAVANRLDHWVVKSAAGKYQLSSVADLIAAALALIIAFFDIIRLREYSRWPGRP